MSYIQVDEEITCQLYLHSYITLYDKFSDFSKNHLQTHFIYKVSQKTDGTLTNNANNINKLLIKEDLYILHEVPSINCQYENFSNTLNLFKNK